MRHIEFKDFWIDVEKAYEVAIEKYQDLKFRILSKLIKLGMVEA